jgi:vitamin B12 transporter
MAASKARACLAQVGAELGALALSGTGGYLRSEGIDSFGAGGERDGFENKAGSFKAVLRPSPGGEFGLVGHYVEGTSEFDGFDPVTFRRADTLDETKNRIAAIRGYGRVEENGWSLLLDGSYLTSANRNRLGQTPLNRTFGERFTIGGQLSKELAIGGGRHRFTAAAEHEGEEFRARDQVFFGGTDQDRARDLTALVGEWRADWSDRFATDVAVRHDSFSAFATRPPSGPPRFSARSSVSLCTPAMARGSHSRPSSTCSAFSRAPLSAMRH